MPEAAVLLPQFWFPSIVPASFGHKNQQSVGAAWCWLNWRHADIPRLLCNPSAIRLPEAAWLKKKATEVSYGSSTGPGAKLQWQHFAYLMMMLKGTTLLLTFLHRQCYHLNLSATGHRPPLPQQQQQKPHQGLLL